MQVGLIQIKAAKMIRVPFRLRNKHCHFRSLSCQALDMRCLQLLLLVVDFCAYDEYWGPRVGGRCFLVSR